MRFCFRNEFIDVYTDGTKSFFNAVLPTKLLYPEDRPQFQKIKEEHPDSDFAAVYGAVHLLRLFRTYLLIFFKETKPKNIKMVFTLSLRMQFLSLYVNIINKPGRSLLMDSECL